MKKETMEYRLEHHLCTRCGYPAVAKKKMCEKHLEESCLKERKKRERRKNKNVCTRCGQCPPTEGKTRCNACMENNKGKYNAKKMDLYYQRRSASYCVRCGIPTDRFLVHCSPCTVYMRQKDKTRYDKHKDAGLCVHCHKCKPIDGEILCLDCKKDNAIRGKDNRTKQKLTIIQHYGGKCQHCGEKDMAVLSIDHIDGGGTQHRKQIKEQGMTFYRWLIKNNYPKGFQTLCFNCNMKKHLNAK